MWLAAGGPTREPLSQRTKSRRRRREREADASHICGDFGDFWAA